MEWRLQSVGLVSGAILAGIPLIFGPQPYSGLGGTALSPNAFASSWNNVASVMQYPLIASLAFVILGIVWKGSQRSRTARFQVFASFFLGGGMLFSLAGVALTTIDYPLGGSATVPAQNLLAFGLLAPTLDFLASMIWLILDGRRNPKLSRRLS